jgi:FKBP-type peptidyl-prolyl cis-trans isomerase 2
MAQAKNGDTVKVHYKGLLEDGTVFDDSSERDPLQFTIGGGQLIPGFEQAVIGMNPGESKKVKVLVDDAYGPPREDLVVEINRNEFPVHLEPKVGQQLQYRGEDNKIMIVSVTAVSETNITLDANHPLAGRDLNFELQLIEIT